MSSISLRLCWIKRFSELEWNEKSNYRFEYIFQAFCYSRIAFSYSRDGNDQQQQETTTCNLCPVVLRPGHFGSAKNWHQVRIVGTKMKILEANHYRENFGWEWREEHAVNLSISCPVNLRQWDAKEQRF